MKKYYFLLVIVLLVSSLVACGSKLDNQNEETNSAENQVEKDETTTEDKEHDERTAIAKFVPEAKDAYSELTTLDERYEELSGVFEANEMNNFEFAAFLRDEIIPTNAKIIAIIEGIDAPNEQTEEIHDLLIMIVTNQQTAFSEALTAIEAGDSSKTFAEMDVLAKVKEDENEFVQEMEKLVDAYQIR